MPPVAVKAELPPNTKLRQLDLPGAVALISSVVCLMLALQWGGIVYAWSNARVYGCLIGFSSTLIVFIAMQWKDKNRQGSPQTHSTAANPSSCTVPLYLFKNRTVCAATAL